MRVFVLTITLGLLLSSCHSENQQEVTQTIKSIHRPNNKPEKMLNVGFLAINGVYNSELMAPYDIFQHTIFHTEHGMRTFIVSPTLEPIVTFEGITITPHFSFNDTPEIDVLVVPSAEHNMGSDLEDKTLIDWVKKTGRDANFVMSLCDGAFILAQAGLLDELKSTTFPTDIEHFKETFPELDVYKGISFVHDGKAITSAGGAKSYDPALYLVEYLYGQKVAIGVGKGLVIEWNLQEIQSIYPNQ